MKKIAAQIIVISIVASAGLAQDIYTVKVGDTLSRLIKRRYPTDRLYGRRGKLLEVLEHNPHIKNSNLIFPNQKINFVPDILVEPISSVGKQTTPIPREKVEGRNLSELKGFEEWNISALYGVKFLSVSQSGALGKAEVGVLFINDLKFNSEFLFEDWSFGFQFDSYKFKYKTLTAGDSKQMYSLNIYGSYDWFLAGLNIEQVPLFRNDNVNIEMNKMTLMSLSLGAKKEFELPTRKPTTLKLKGWVSYSLSASSDNADIKLDSLKGYGVTGQFELDRQIFSKNDYSLHATWMNQVGIQKINQEVEWGTSAGESKSSIVNASTSLGLMLKL